MRKKRLRLRIKAGLCPLGKVAEGDLPPPGSKRRQRIRRRSQAIATAMEPAQKAKVKKVMGEFKQGELPSGSKRGPKVRKRKQAIAIALSSAKKITKKKKKVTK